MGAWSNDALMDAAHNEEKTNVTTMHVCAGQPVDRADAITKSLANVAFISTDITLADGDVSGRKAIHAQKAAISILVSGSADHVVTVDATRLLRVFTCTLQGLTVGGTVTVPAHDAEIADPA